MDQSARLRLHEIKEDTKQILDLQVGHEEPDHIANYIYNQCSHPIYYMHGFYKIPNYWKNEIYPIKATKETCDYCLVQCLECGDFEGIYKPRKGSNHNWVKIKGQSSSIIVSSKSYEKVRDEYLENCLYRNEKDIVKMLKRDYKTVNKNSKI